MVDTTNIISYWKCEDNAATTTVTDSHGSQDLTASSNTSTLSAVGKIDNGFDFATSNDGMNKTSFPYQSTGSVSIWAKYSSTANGQTQTINTADGNGGLNLQIFGGKFYAKVNDGEFLISTTSPSTGTWYHIVITWDGTTEKLYINNSLERTRTDGASTNTSTIRIGTDGSNCKAIVDEIGIWGGEALTSTEVGELYNSGNGLAYPFSSDVDLTPSTLTLSTEDESPNYFLDIMVGALNIETQILNPEVYVPLAVYPETLTVDGRVWEFDFPVETQGGATIGTTFIANRYPVQEGLIARTTKQTGNPNLVPRERGTW